MQPLVHCVMILQTVRNWLFGSNFDFNHNKKNFRLFVCKPDHRMTTVTYIFSGHNKLAWSWLFFTEILFEIFKYIIQFHFLNFLYSLMLDNDNLMSLISQWLTRIRANMRSWNKWAAIALHICFLLAPDVWPLAQSRDLNLPTGA